MTAKTDNKTDSIDIDNYFSEAYKVNHEQYVQDIEPKLEKLIYSELSHHRFSDFVIVGRKGVTLFQPYIINRDNYKLHKLQGIYSIQLFSFTKNSFIKSWRSSRFSGFAPLHVIERHLKKRFGKIILLTDAINSGGEISKIIEEIGARNILKVCGYLANRDTLSKLQEEKYPKIQFSFITIVPNEFEYDKEQDKLQHIYQCRPIPYEGDHPYRVYSLKTHLVNIELIKFLSQSIDKFKQKNETLEKKKLLVPYIHSYSATLDFNLVSQLNPEFKQIIFEVERIQIRFKINSKSSQLIIMASAFDISDTASNQKTPIVYQNCGISTFTKMCNTIRIPSPHALQDDPREKICPLCIDNNISNFINSETENELFRILKLKGGGIERTESLEI